MIDVGGGCADDLKISIYKARTVAGKVKCG